MTFKKTLMLLVTGALIAGGVFGAVLFQSAMAQDENPGSTTPEVGAATTAQTDSSRADFARGEMGRKGLGGAQDEELAAALGITVDELTAARQEAYQAAVDLALEKGLITQAQADQLKTGDGAYLGRWLKDSDIDHEALLAEALGITVEKLQEAKTAAFNARLDQAVAHGTLTQEQADLMKGRRALVSSDAFQTSMQSAFEAAVAQAVTDGTITQAQADLILADAPAFDGSHGMGGFGGPRGGRHGGMGGFPPPADQP